MDENSFSQLKTSIAKLKRERDEVMAELMKERQQLAYLDKEMNRVRVEVDYHNSNVREYEKYIGDYNRVIEESERTYGKIVDSTAKLIDALESESASLKDRVKR
eukprot:TRINITY_DN9993_c0_g1_i6.p1 TRINITY_DN9993_c0_g1~~TRINITY_DN9993_c0_g1_i6.p1  ORF type:complete len:104 (-),score=18.57 TRINITY_DN9993_c0_g1_i6:71-382(-)